MFLRAKTVAIWVLCFAGVLGLNPGIARSHDAGGACRRYCRRHLCNAAPGVFVAVESPWQASCLGALPCRPTGAWYIGPVDCCVVSPEPSASTVPNARPKQPCDAPAPEREKDGSKRRGEATRGGGPSTVALRLCCPGDALVTINNEATVSRGTRRLYKLPVPKGGEYKYRIAAAIKRGPQRYAYGETVVVSDSRGVSLLTGASKTPLEGALVFNEPDPFGEPQLADNSGFPLYSVAVDPVAVAAAVAQASPTPAVPSYSIQETPQLTTDVASGAAGLPDAPTVVATVEYNSAADAQQDETKKVGSAKALLFHGLTPNKLTIVGTGTVPNADFAIGEAQLSFQMTVNGIRDAKGALTGRQLGAAVTLQNAMKLSANGEGSIDFEAPKAANRGELLTKIVEQLLKADATGLQEDLRPQWIAVDLTLTFDPQTKKQVRKLTKLLIIKLVPAP